MCVSNSNPHHRNGTYQKSVSYHRVSFMCKYLSAIYHHNHHTTTIAYNSHGRNIFTNITGGYKITPLKPFVVWCFCNGSSIHICNVYINICGYTDIFVYNYANTFWAVSACWFTKFHKL